MIRRDRLAGGILAAAACLGAAIALQVTRDRLYPRRESDERIMYLRSPEALRRIVLSFDALAADVYWIRALQHYGGDRLDPERTRKYELLYPLLDLTTSLDPYFTIAYRFGAIFLSEPYPGGAGRPDQAVALLRKGIGVEPRKWQYYHDIGFVYYWRLRDTQAAAKWFRMAATQPNAPEWLEPLAATTLVKGGDRPSARILFGEILKSEEPWLRRLAARALLQLDALDAIDQLERFVRANPPPPGEGYSWDLYVRQRKLRGVPADPTGVPFDIDAATGRVAVSRGSELFPMPRREDQ